MIELEIRGFDKLQELSNRFPRVAETYVTKAIRNSLIRIQDRAKRSAPFGTTSQLRQNWILQIGRFEGRLGSGAKSGGYEYGSSVEYGRAPGHYIPVKNSPQFVLWANRRGLNPYAVAKSIQKKGTKPNPFFQNAIDDSAREVNDEFDQAINDILENI